MAHKKEQAESDIEYPEEEAANIAAGFTFDQEDNIVFEACNFISHHLFRVMERGHLMVVRSE